MAGHTGPVSQQQRFFNTDLKTLSDHATQLDTAFMTILSRRPTDIEQKQILSYLRNQADDDAMQHVVWALLTSPEMRFNH